MIGCGLGFLAGLREAFRERRPSTSSALRLTMSSSSLELNSELPLRWEMSLRMLKPGRDGMVAADPGETSETPDGSGITWPI